MNTYSVTDLRQKTNSVLASAKQLGYVSVVKNSQHDVYVVDAKYFQAMQDMQEDYLDNLEFDAGEASLKSGQHIPLSQL